MLCMGETAIEGLKIYQEIKDSAFSVLLIVGIFVALYMIIKAYPEWHKGQAEIQAGIDKAKEDRARIYADGLKSLGESHNKALEKIGEQHSAALGKLGEQIGNMGKEVNALAGLVGRVMDFFQKYQEDFETLDQRCQRHGETLARLKAHAESERREYV